MTIASSLFSALAKTLRPSSKSAALVAPAALCMGLAGCADEEQSGTLTINYQFGAGAASCADSDMVQTVRVTLDGMQFAEEACDDTGSISLPSVPAKNYGSLIVEGVDAEGTTVRDNLAPPTEDESVEVVGGSAVVKDVRLTPTPATVRFQFILLDENELPYAPAATIPIKEFRTEAFRQGGNLLLLGHAFIVDAARDVPRRHARSRSRDRGHRPRLHRGGRGGPKRRAGQHPNGHVQLLRVPASWSWSGSRCTRHDVHRRARDHGRRDRSHRR